MTTEVTFWAEPEHTAGIRAAMGSGAALQNVPQCVFNVGDTFSFPAPANRLAYRVLSRHYQPMADGTAKWVLKIEPSPHPITE